MSDPRTVVLFLSACLLIPPACADATAALPPSAPPAFSEQDAEGMLLRDRADSLSAAALAQPMATTCDGTAPRARYAFNACAGAVDGTWFELPIVPHGVYGFGALDTHRDRIITTGGGPQDLWAYSIGPDAEWRQLCATGPPPGGVFAVAHDAEGDRMFYYAINPLGADIWELILSDLRWRRLAADPAGRNPAGNALQSHGGVRRNAGTSGRHARHSWNRRVRVDAA